MKLKQLIFALAIMSFSANAAAQDANEVIFDFQKLDANNQIYGVDITISGQKCDVTGKEFVNGGCTIIAGAQAADENGDTGGTAGTAEIRYYVAGDSYLLSLKSNSTLKISSSEYAMSKVTFTLYSGSIGGWTTGDVGTIDATTNTWTGSVNEIIFNIQNLSAVITGITITLDNNNYTEVASVEALKQISDGTLVTYTGEVTCLAQSTDKQSILVSDGTDAMYYASSTSTIDITMGRMLQAA